MRRVKLFQPRNVCTGTWIKKGGTTSSFTKGPFGGSAVTSFLKSEKLLNLYIWLIWYDFSFIL